MSFFQLFILYINSFIFIQSNYNTDELNSIINEYESNISQAKLISCLNLLNSFLAQRDGDQKLKSQIKLTKFPHDKFYIKFIASSIKNCYEKINNNQASYLLTQENSDNYNTLNSSLTNLIKCDEIKNVELTNDERDIYDKISKKFSDFIQNKTNKKKKINFFEKNKFWITFAFIALGCFLFYLRYLRKNDTIKEKQKNKSNDNYKKNNKRKGKKY